MNTGRKNKRIAFIMAIGILIGLTGCSKGNTKDDEAPKVIGTYQESKIDLPELSKHEEVVTLADDSLGTTHLCTYQVEKTVEIKDYVMKQDESFELNKTITIDDVDPNHVDFVKVCLGYEGNYYINVQSENKDVWTSKLYECNNSNEVHQLTWKQKDSESSYFSGFYVLEGNQIFIDNQEELYQYAGEDQPLKEVLDISNYGEYEFVAGKKHIAILGDEEEMQVNELYVYDIDSKETATYKMDNVSQYGLCGFMYDDDNIVLCGSNGIFEKKADTTLWKQIIDGTKYSMYSPAYYTKGVARLGDDNYLILYRVGKTVELMKYEYVETEVKEKTQLTIYTLETNTAIREAMTVFRRTHPDVEITLEEAMQDDTAVTKSDYIQALNTKLLNGGGADIINLDGINYEPYIQKGALADLSSVIQPMIDKKEVLTNVMEQYKRGDAFYAIPVFVQLPLVYATENLNMDDITWLTKPSKDQKTSLVPNIEWNEMLDHTLPVYYDDMVDGENVNEDKIKQFVTEFKSYEDKKAGQNIKYNDSYWQLAQGIPYYPETSYGFTDLVFITSVQDVLHSSYECMKQSFIPSIELAVNSNSKNTELAKEFVALMLSDEIQRFELFYGYPVNTKTIKDFYKMDEKEYDGTMSYIDEDGVEHEYPIKWLSDENLDKVTGILESVNNKAEVDDAVVKIFHDNLSEYLKDESTFDETVTKISNQLELYLRE